MLGAVCHDLGKPATTAFIDGRIRSLDHEQAGVAPTTALLDRLNIHTIDGFDVRRAGGRPGRAPPEAGHVPQGARQVGDGAFRRLAQKVDLELLARARARRLPRPHRRRSTARRWTGSSSARARSACEHAPPAPLAARPAPAGAGPDARARSRRDAEGGLREAARSARSRRRRKGLRLRAKHLLKCEVRSTKAEVRSKCSNFEVRT